MRRGVVLWGLVGVLLLIPGLAGRPRGPFSCSNAGGKATASLRAEIQALPSTRDAWIVACDSGDPSSVDFTSLSSSGLINDLVRQKGCREVADPSPDNSDGTAYKCKLQAGTTQVWVEKDPLHSTSSAIVTSAD